MAVDYDDDIKALTYRFEGVVIARELGTWRCYVARVEFPELIAGYDDFFEVFTVISDK